MINKTLSNHTYCNYNITKSKNFKSAIMKLSSFRSDQKTLKPIDRLLNYRFCRKQVTYAIKISYNNKHLP